MVFTAFCVESSFSNTIKMNIYGCVPPTYINAPTSLSYWAHAHAALAALPGSDLSSVGLSFSKGLPLPELSKQSLAFNKGVSLSDLSPTNLALSLKSSQFPPSLAEVLHKTRDGSFQRFSDDIMGYHMTSRSTPTSSGEITRLSASTQDQLLSHIQQQQHHQQQQEQQQQQQQHYQVNYAMLNGY